MTIVQKHTIEAKHATLASMVSYWMSVSLSSDPVAVPSWGHPEHTGAHHLLPSCTAPPRSDAALKPEACARQAPFRRRPVTAPDTLHPCARAAEGAGKVPPGRPPDEARDCEGRDPLRGRPPPCPRSGGPVASGGLYERPRPFFRAPAFPMQLMLDQRRRRGAGGGWAEASSSCHYKDSGYQEPHATAALHAPTAEEPDSRTSEKEGRKMWIGMGVGVGGGRPGHPPYVSLNLHQVFGHRSSTLRAPAYTHALGHCADGYGHDATSYGNKSQCPALGPAQGGPGDIPHYIGTSVIRTNER
ncbi:hypothetical protein NHX12_010115 [Muraenolepis orangiensis]|uniref:Uncharacterized protein n=1 Tax=Muraenolepis orangiensis TaxID=630683 RepID=A0A9Q0I8K7_9TELE|nr:hypothetical protein NHX12_010115 [Muraenolepis orangiensis]